MYEATKDFAFDGPDGMPRRAKTGQRLDAAAILPGCLDAALRTGALVRIEPDQLAAEQANAAAAQAADRAEQAKKKTEKKP